MGLEFFEKVVALQQKHSRSGMVVTNGLQTNATLIDDGLAAHFSRYGYLLGCSLDGPPQIHNKFRLNNAGKPSFDEVIKGLNILKQRQVEFNILVLVSQANVKQAKTVYHYLVDNGFFYHQYIPCVEFDDKGAQLPFAINAPIEANLEKVAVYTWQMHLNAIKHGYKGLGPFGINIVFRTDRPRRRADQDPVQLPAY